ARVAAAVRQQRMRYQGLGFSSNARIPPGLVERLCPVDAACLGVLEESFARYSLSARAYHSVIRVARTIADLAGAPKIRSEHIEEAVNLRRYGEGSYFWSFD
ncbi:MAG: ATP-binding protein, partial [Spirochaetales bacterium]|nr:ATP-binding protein [Spirochaetales bacterium]